jgi:hypothetical protein
VVKQFAQQTWGIGFFFFDRVGNWISLLLLANPADLVPKADQTAFNVVFHAQKDGAKFILYLYHSK